MLANPNETTTKEFIQSFRDRIGDTSKSVPASYIISYLNTALRRLAKQDGLERLYEHRDTFQLAAINKDGTPSAAWDLGKIGTIIDIRKMRILQTNNSEICELKPRFVEYEDFFDRCALPERATPGKPCYYTIEQIATINRLLLDRPPKDLVTIDLYYSAFHPKITSEIDIIQINWNYLDIFEEYCLILHKIETTDMATGRALTEDLDVITADAKELLAKRKGALPYRRIGTSF